jgi:Protein of unknown function (DUF3078)
MEHSPAEPERKIIIVSAGLFAFAAGALPPHPRDTKARNEFFGQQEDFAPSCHRRDCRHRCLHAEPESISPPPGSFISSFSVRRSFHYPFIASSPSCPVFWTQPSESLMRSFTFPVATLIAVVGSSSLFAAEQNTTPPAVIPAVPGAAAPATALPSDWTHTGRLGLFFTNVSSSNEETSRDATIQGTSNSISYMGSFDGQSNWKSGKNSVDNLLKLRYGRIRTEGQDWKENNDEMRYDGVYRREISTPHFVYLGWGGESVFTGPEPEKNALDPITGKVSGGYGQRYADFIADKNSLEFRLGARAQKKWGDSISGDDEDVQTGLEAFARYEHAVKRHNGEYDMRLFVQYEGFGEFDDLQHVTNLITAGLTVQISRYLTLELGVRAYYETRTKEDDGSLLGYNEWSVRQDTLIGLTYQY